MLQTGMTCRSWRFHLFCPSPRWFVVGFTRGLRADRLATLRARYLEAVANDDPNQRAVEDSLNHVMHDKTSQQATVTTASRTSTNGCARSSRRSGSTRSIGTPSASYLSSARTCSTATGISSLSWPTKPGRHPASSYRRAARPCSGPLTRRASAASGNVCDVRR